MRRATVKRILALALVSMTVTKPVSAQTPKAASQAPTISATQPFLSPAARSIIDAAISALRIIPGVAEAGNAINALEAVVKAIIALDTIFSDSTATPSRSATTQITQHLSDLDSARQRLTQVVANVPRDSGSVERLKVLESAMKQIRIAEAGIAGRAGELASRVESLEGNVTALAAKERADVAGLAERVSEIERALGVGRSLSGAPALQGGPQRAPTTEEVAYWSLLEEQVVGDYNAAIRWTAAAFGWSGARLVDELQVFKLPTVHQRVSSVVDLTRRKLNVVTVARDLARIDCARLMRSQTTPAGTARAAQDLRTLESPEAQRQLAKVADELVVQQFRQFSCLTDQAFTSDLARQASPSYYTATSRIAGEASYPWFDSIVDLRFIPPTSRGQYIASLEAELAKGNVIR